MNTVEEYLADERMQSAVNELQSVISEAFPVVEYELYVWDDPEGLYLRTVVDLDDTDEVTDHVIDRLVRMYFDEQLPIHLIPVRTPERRAALWEAELKRREQLRTTS